MVAAWVVSNTHIGLRATSALLQSPMCLPSAGAEQRPGQRLHAQADNILIKFAAGGPDAHLRALERDLSVLGEGGAILNLKS